jgi:site-specific DNA-methyltransferase (adenine-specific)
MGSVAPICDHAISDPPYGRDVYLRAAAVYTKAGSGTPKRMGLSEQKRRGGALQKMANGDIGAIDDLIVPVAGLLAKLVSRWAIAFSDVESCHAWRSAFDSAGMRYVRTGAWVKPDAMPQMSGDRPGTGFEPCTIAHAQGPMRWNGGGSLATWTHFTAKGAGRPEGHPCPKPLPLMVQLVKLFTDAGETILDPFGGSGTTAVAAKLNGRKCVLIEREEKYCEIAANRLRQTYTGRLFDKSPKAKPQSLLDAETAA